MSNASRGMEAPAGPAPLHDPRPIPSARLVPDAAACLPFIETAALELFAGNPTRAAFSAGVAYALACIECGAHPRRIGFLGADDGTD